MIKAAVRWVLTASDLQFAGESKVGKAPKSDPVTMTIGTDKNKIDLPRDPIIGFGVAKVFNQPQPIRREHHDRMKDVEEPVEPSEIRIPRANLQNTYQTKTTYFLVSRPTERWDEDKRLTIDLIGGLSSG